MDAETRRARGVLDHSHVLVVEDNWHVASSMKKWLEAEGAHVVGPASTPSIGRLLADIHKPQVAIIDLNLGGTYAYPLIEWLNSCGVPVIVVTAYSFAGAVTPNLGAVLQKPIEKETLVDAVRAAQETLRDAASSHDAKSRIGLH